MDTFISILVALDVDEQLALFLPESPPSPVLLAKARGIQRKRASGTHKEHRVRQNKDELGW